MSTSDSLQHSFNFAGDDRKIQLREPNFKSLFSKLQGVFDNGAKAYEQSLIDQGIPLFPVITENDHESVETDYGAPLFGLTCFGEFINPERAFRYEPVTTVVGDEYHTHIDQKLAIADQMRSEGYLSVYDWFGSDMLASQIHFANGGVTRAFSDVAKRIVETFEKMNAMARDLGRAQTGAILVPVPTYGLFLDRLEEIVKGTDVEIVKINRRDNGSVDRKALKAKLLACAQEDRRVIGYYDCNPNNPTGYIRDKAETEKIADMLETFTKLQMLSDQQFIEDSRSGWENSSGKYVGLHLYYDQDGLGRPIIMDDMAYEGLEINLGKKPYSFAQASESIAAQTVVMKSISKIGMPGMRIGLAVADPEIFGDVFEKQIMTEFSANSFGVDILTARYGRHPKKHLFKIHQEKLRNAHLERFLFTKAFFRGIDNVPELSDKQRTKLIREYARNGGVQKSEAEKRLRRGLPNFHVPDTLESGFFCPVHCESLLGRTVAIKYDKEKWPHLMEINSSSVLYWTFRAFKVKMVASVQQGLSNKSLTGRMTLSVNGKDFYRYFDQMTKMHDFFFGKTPEVQMDLFRHFKPK